jgi:transposase
MMGSKVRTLAPVVAVSLEALVPPDHFYRHLDRTLDLSFVRDLVKDTYAAGGRPSIDPVVFFRLQLVMFFEDIRSERLLMRLVADKLSVRWYLGYDLNEPLPDHSSLTRIRSRYGLEVFRRFFDAIVEQCCQAKLVWGRELYVDATQVNANAAYTSLTPRFVVEARTAIQEHLAALFPQDEAQEQPDEPKEVAPCEAVTPAPLPVAISEEVRQELTDRNEARHDWIAEEGRQQREVTNRNYQRVADFLVSTTDPDATPMRLKGSGIRLGYHTHYVVDGGKQRIIMQVLVTPAEVMENQPMLDLLWRVRFRWKLWPRQATGDKKYGTVENLVAIECEHLHAYIPSADLTQRRPVFSPDHFQYDAARDVYICPAGKELAFSRWQTTETSRRYRARPSDCNACPLKAQCTTGKQGRSLCRDVDEVILDRVRAYRLTAAYQKAIRKRSVWVEPLFAEGKDWHGMRRFRLRRLWRVNCEALMIAAGQNLKRLLSKRGWGRRPLPSGAALHFKCITLLFWMVSIQVVFFVASCPEI